VLERREHPDAGVIAAHHVDALFQETLQDYYLYCEGEPALLFTENETNNARLFGGNNASPYVKDGINDCLVLEKMDAVNPAGRGTKASAQYPITSAQVTRERCDYG
jgi:hypothetical protein